MEISIMVLIVLITLFVILIIGRNYYVKYLVSLKQKQKYDEYFQKLDSTMAVIFVQKINRLYLKLNGYKDLQEYEKVDAVMDEMLQLKMNDLQKEDFYFHQYHYYILRNDQAYIDIFMNHLKELKDDTYYKIAQYAIEVIRNGRNDLIDEIDREIDYLKGNNLGIACYLIALQYLRLDNKPQAKLYFQSAAVVTMHSIYDPLTKKHLAELESTVPAEPKQ